MAPPSNGLQIAGCHADGNPVMPCNPKAGGVSVLRVDRDSCCHAASSNGIRGLKLSGNFEREESSMWREFVDFAEKGHEPFSAICARFGISRKTGYKWLNRFRAEGDAGLSNRAGDRKRCRARHPTRSRSWPYRCEPRIPIGARRRSVRKSMRAVLRPCRHPARSISYFGVAGSFWHSSRLRRLSFRMLCDSSQTFAGRSGYSRRSAFPVPAQ